jgi:hypothetical protein
MLQIPKDVLKIIVQDFDPVTRVMCRLTCWDLWLFIKAKGNYRDISTLNAAAKYGYPAVMNYLINTGSSVSESTSIIAAENGHLEILKYLKSKNLLSDGSLLGVTAGQMEDGEIPFNAELLDWLYDTCENKSFSEPRWKNEPYFNMNVVIKLLSWIKSRNPAWQNYGYLLRNCFIQSGDYFELLEWFLENGETFNDYYIDECHDVEKLKWLHKHNLLNHDRMERLKELIDDIADIVDADLQVG